MSPQANSRTQLAPDKASLTESQASVLGSLTGIDASKLKGLSVAEISSEFRWRIDPNLLLFTRVCGQVVKQDPVSGQQYPVPFATVYAEETVCSLFGYFPIGLPWTWFFPFHCLTEVVAQTTTDACGNFCIWVPRFMIEWILRFRIERICYLELFNKPTVASVIAYLQGNPIGPDPGPEARANVALKPGTPLYQKAEQLLGVKPLGLPIQANRRFWRAQPSPRPWLRHCPKPSERLSASTPRNIRPPSEVRWPTISAWRRANSMVSIWPSTMGLSCAATTSLCPSGCPSLKCRISPSALHRT